MLILAKGKKIMAKVTGKLVTASKEMGRKCRHCHFMGIETAERHRKMETQSVVKKIEFEETEEYIYLEALIAIVEEKVIN